MPASFDLQQALERYRDLVVPRLLALVRSREPRRYLYDLIEAHLGGVGKALRPALCLATTEAYGGDIEKAMPAAVAVEMLHNAFLVHDDIEDGSESRRNQPPLYLSHGVPLALNAGDAMQALAVRVLRDNVAMLGPSLSWRIVDEFDAMLMESLEGQAMELGWIRDNDCSITEDQYLVMALKKTCWYSFITPARIGALIARGESFGVDRFDRFGYLLGIAFQIQDDVLNLVGDERRYGKEIGGDLWEGKRTLILSHLFGHAPEDDTIRAARLLSQPRTERDAREIAWLGQRLASLGSIDHARATARELAQGAEREFELAYADAPESESKQFVRHLVRYVVERDL